MGERKKSNELIKVLNDVFYQVTAKPSAIVCVMGSNIAMPGFFCTEQQKHYMRMVLI